MNESPKTLEELCLDTISYNILKYIQPKVNPDDQHSLNIHLDFESDDYDDEFKPQYIFKDPDIYLINTLSDKLLKNFVDKRLICDALLNIFTKQHTSLRNVAFKKCKLTKTGCRILRQHRITNLEFLNIKTIAISEILDCLSEWSLENMRHVNFTDCTFVDSAGYTLMVKLCSLKNIRSLNLAYTELNQNCFKMICEDLQYLQELDVSGTQIKDLQPLFKIASSLHSLAICDLPFIANMEVIQRLTLKHLDLSLQKVQASSNWCENSVNLILKMNLSPDFKSLDVSGWRDYIPLPSLQKFIRLHPKMEYLGIVLCADCPELSDPKNKNYPHHMTIAGLGNEAQICVTLKRHTNRAYYMQKALYHLFQLSHKFQEARVDVFNLVLPVMDAHSKMGLQLAATACLYNLTRGELSKQIHPNTLSKAVNLTLLAMASFPMEYQLQKNSLLTLCSERILAEVSFDRFHCAKLVLDALCAFEDVNMNRMAVAICSILASKVSTAETSELGARPDYMRKLLAMVQSRIETREADTTLNFTLSALWNLTDESAATCTVFLEQDGAYLFLKMLRMFKDINPIETKVLGLLNNIAEVKQLRHGLMLDDLMMELFTLLKSENIDVSYFAAGIVAHLASDGASHWTVASHGRNEMLVELEIAMSQWKVPESEMVTYRSFKPFFSLLRTDMDYEVQLWAVWAIHHVCTKNPQRYCMMLQDEHGSNLLYDLMNSEDPHPDIKDKCLQILEAIKCNGK